VSADILHRIPLFASLPEDEMARVAHALKEGRYAAGEALFIEGDAGDRFYIISAGQLEVVKALGTPDERVIGVRGPGDYVGEMSLILVDGKRTASIRARTPLHTLEMTRADFDTLLHRQPQMAHQMARVLGEHLNEAHATSIHDMREKNRELSAAYESLKAAQAQLIQKEKLEHELRMARSVQAGLLPRNTPGIPGWEFAAQWHPAREVSGDFYDFMALSEAGAMCVMVADVSDKGMPAALFTTLSRSVLRACITTPPALAESIQRANRLICADSADRMFVTLFVCALDPRSGTFSYVNAGHNLPLLFRAATRQWHELDASGMAMGVMDDVAYAQNADSLHAGDVLVIYTDGLTDAVNASGELFGNDRLMAVLHQAEGESAAGIAQALSRAMADYTVGLEPFDDMTCVVIKRA
jgi:serine phosphatase RsbU (regulator of sigma subunit)